MPFDAVRVEGLADLERGLRELSRDLKLGLNRDLVEAAQPARALAESLAVEKISGLARSKVPWQEMRLGTTGPLVYMAPKQRGTKHPLHQRPNFGALLVAKAMEPALAATEPQIAAAAQRAVDTTIRKAGF